MAATSIDQFLAVTRLYLLTTQATDDHSGHLATELE